MSVHTHAMRNWCTTALVLVPAPLLLGWASAPGAKDFKLAQVSGQVTWADQPFSGLIYFIPENPQAAHAMGRVNPDGSFELYINGQLDLRGVVPGMYRVIVCPRVSDKAGSRVDSKYQNPQTSDLRVHVGPDWNYIRLRLQ